METPVTRAARQALLVLSGIQATLFLAVFVGLLFGMTFVTSAPNAIAVILTYLETVLCSIAFLLVTMVKNTLTNSSRTKRK